MRDDLLLAKLIVFFPKYKLNTRLCTYCVLSMRKAGCAHKTNGTRAGVRLQKYRNPAILAYRCRVVINLFQNRPWPAASPLEQRLGPLQVGLLARDHRFRALDLVLKPGDVVAQIVHRPAAEVLGL